MECNVRWKIYNLVKQIEKSCEESRPINTKAFHYFFCYDSDVKYQRKIACKNGKNSTS